MKVIIGCLNSKYIHASLAPWCLLAGMRKFCKSDIDAVVVESTINADLDDFVAGIPTADIYAFSCYIWNIEQTLYVCKKLKEKFECKIILGGPEVAYRAKDVLERYRFIDFVLSGEGEYNFPKLIDALNFKLSLEVVYGLTFRENGSILSIPEAVHTDTPPSPYSQEFFDSLNGRICYIETSRGCPYRCAFCLSGRCSSLRFFDIETVKENIILLANSGTKTVKFVDRTFNANYKRANEILLFIKDNYGTKIPDGICFHFEIAGDILHEDTLAILSQMPPRAVQLEIGMQSFNEETLKLINRKTNTQKLIKNIKTLLSFNNMHIHIDLIAGLTGEDLLSFKNSFNIGYNLHAHMLQMGFLKLLYGSDMREQSDKYPCEYSDKPPYEVTSTPWLTADEILKLKNCEDALERLYNSGRFLLTLDYLVNEIGIEPFDLFFEFGNAVNGNETGLSVYVSKLYEFFKEKCNSEILREKIVCDMLKSGCEKHIPEALKIKDPLYKKAKADLSEKLGNDFSFAVLYSKNKVFAVTPNEPRDLFGRKQGAMLELPRSKD
ncbi:MAG: DUF4080 domain-containing protein [Clostridia bacterium]|nr:DUF4080 domain-containing protein [Clostridia bacterium]MBR6564323.1 DUF4080 domain-containing protein [Clostridia bacterium]